MFTAFIVFNSTMYQAVTEPYAAYLRAKLRPWHGQVCRQARMPATWPQNVHQDEPAAANVYNIFTIS